MTRLVHVTTVPQTATSFLAGQLRWMGDQGIDVTLVTSPGSELLDFARQENITSRPVAMQRTISPLHDAPAIARLTRVFREIRPDIVHAHTPKAGLLAMTAARACHVPLRIYHFHGLRFETTEGWLRSLLVQAERCSCRLSTDILSVSDSVRRAAVAAGLVELHQVKLLHRGSVNGVDASRFDPTDACRQRRHVRKSLDIPPDALVLGFVGRIVRDKGIVELAQAWRMLRDRFDNLHLMVVGSFERHDPVPTRVQDDLKADPRVHLTGQAASTVAYYAATDVFTLPSHREGMPTVLLEAASMQLPTVTCRTTGCVDSIVDGETGTLVQPHNPRQLARAIGRYLADKQLRDEHGRAGRARVIRDFQPFHVWRATYAYYQDRLAQIRQMKLARRAAA